MSKLEYIFTGRISHTEANSASCPTHYFSNSILGLRVVVEVLQKEADLHRTHAMNRANHLVQFLVLVLACSPLILETVDHSKCTFEFGLQHVSLFLSKRESHAKRQRVARGLFDFVFFGYAGLKVEFVWTSLRALRIDLKVCRSQGSERILFSLALDDSVSGADFWRGRVARGKLTDWLVPREYTS